jgi:hypothetical protein
MHTKFCSKNLKGRDHLEDSGLDGRLLSKFILEVVCVWAGHVWHRQTPIAVSCEDFIEFWVS